LYLQFYAKKALRIFVPNQYYI